MIIFLDTSAWVKFFIEEEGTSETHNFIVEKSNSEDNTFAASAVTYAEMKATFKRALKSKRITEQEFKKIKNEFDSQWQNVDIPLVDKALIEKSGELVEQHALKRKTGWRR